MAKNNYSFLLIIGIFISNVPFCLCEDRPQLSSQPRYEEDYRFLTDPTKRSDIFDQVKFVSLSDDKDIFVSFGGEDRERFEDFIKKPLFGITNLNSDNYLLHRTLLHSDIHITDYFRSFIQLGYHNVWSKEGSITSTERSNTDIQQAFAEADLPLASDEKIGLRVGRQEIALGSQRLVSVREGPNIRQSFDAIRSTFKDASYNVTGFVAHPVSIKADAFDDTSDQKQDFWGFYGTVPLGKALNSDLYYLGLSRDDSKFAQGTGNEKRHSVGTRLWGTTLPFDYNIEGVYQFGTFGEGDISAWTFASDNGYNNKELPWQPRFGIKADVASGDKDNTDKDLNTFNALFPKGAYFTENALIGPANFIDLQPNILLKPLHDVSINAGADILWRENTNDAIYRQPNIAIPKTAGLGGQYTGTQNFILSTWQIDPHLSFTATYVYFVVGNAIKLAGGKDVQYLGSWVTYRF